MAICQITEFFDTQIVNGSVLPVGKTIAAVQSVTYTAASNSSPIQDGVKFVRIVADADVYITFNGQAATASSMRIPADVVEYFGIGAGAVISCYDGVS